MASWRTAKGKQAPDKRGIAPNTIRRECRSSQTMSKDAETKVYGGAYGRGGLKNARARAGINMVRREI